MSNEYQTPGVIKTYDIGTDHVHTQRVLEIQHNTVPILWAGTSFGVINITSDGDGLQTLAAVMPKSFYSVRVMLGPNPHALPKDAWADVLPEGRRSSQHAFMFDDRLFWWRRMHDKSNGASLMGGHDFKLVDGDDRAIAVYIDDRRTFHVEKIGRIDYFVELGRYLELFSLAAILGIQHGIRRLA
uniref:Uncharacterized protein n=1 Tax=Ramularia collo-cygni TaxID=112498 RepID=A0A2D3V8D4_9PEZI